MQKTTMLDWRTMDFYLNEGFAIIASGFVPVLLPFSLLTLFLQFFDNLSFLRGTTSICLLFIISETERLHNCSK